MIEAAAITLREAIEAVLVIVLMASYLQRTGEPQRKKYVYRGAFAAVLFSLVLGVVLAYVGIDPENEIVEGTLFLGAAVLVAGLVIWMWRHARHMKAEVAAKLQKAGGALGLSLVAFLMVAREGVETVIFLETLLLAGTSPVENFIGGLFGISLAVAFGMVFLKGSLKINLSMFFRVTSIILGILVIKLLANGFHEFFEFGLLPSTPALMTVVGFLARSSTGAMIIALMLVFLIGMIIYDLLRSPRPQLSALRPAEQRKVRFNLMKEKYSKVGLCAVMVLMVGVLLTPTLLASHLALPQPLAVEAREGELHLPFPSSDGFYKYQFGKVRIIMVVKDGKPQVGLDVCYICPPKGYGFDGRILVCTNCGAPTAPEAMGNPGGCSPYVIPYDVRDGEVTVSAAIFPELEKLFP